MADTDTEVAENAEVLQVWRWRRDELDRLGFTQKQRGHLLAMIAQHELMLHDVQHPIDDLGWTAEQTWWVVS